MNADKALSIVYHCHYQYERKTTTKDNNQGKEWEILI